MTGTPAQLMIALAKVADTDTSLYDVTPHKEKRSLNANALLWYCIGQIAAKMRIDKWDVYLDLLKHYGTFTYVLCKPKAVDKMREMWRETEVLGEVEVNGETAVQLLCYFGSSTMNTKEFSVLLEGCMQEMKNLDLTLPTTAQMEEALLAWSKMTEKKDDHSKRNEHRD